MKLLGVGILVWIAVAWPGSNDDCPVQAAELQRFEFSQRHMGTSFRLLFYAFDDKVANAGAAAAFDRVARLDSVFSDYDSESEIMRLCSNSAAYAKDSAGVPVGDDLWRVLTASQELSCRSDGAFDITVGPLTKLWRRARRQHALPAIAELAAARTLVGYQRVELVEVNQSVRFGDSVVENSVRMDFGGIAKGYAADAALANDRLPCLPTLPHLRAAALGVREQQLIQAPARDTDPVAVMAFERREREVELTPTPVRDATGVDRRDTASE